MGARCLALALTLALAACGGQYGLVKPGPQSVAGGYSARPSVAWNSRSADGAEIWTVDGEALQSITFLKGVGDGDPLFPARGKQSFPRFRAAMTPSDIAELFADSLTIGGLADAEVSGLRPQPFGATQGFRFEFSYLSKEGLGYLGSAAGAVVDGELRLVYYAATRLHYYEQHRGEFERIAEQMTFT